MERLIAGVREYWPLILSAAHVAAAAWVTVDAVLRKRHVSAVVGWVGLAWLAPVAGALAYYLLGINRIHRAASALDFKSGAAAQERLPMAAFVLSRDAVARLYPGFAGLDHLGERVAGRPLLGGNRVEPLRDGDAAYPAMLAAIDAARDSVTLASYIFDQDAAGEAFLAALARARRRGVEVRVLIDDVGARYSRPSMVGELRDADVSVATFLPTRVRRLFQYANLRNHRKLLVVDGRIGFTGGMNIRAGHWRSRHPKSAIQCMHFRVEGPVVADMQYAFAVDWAFTTGERIGGERWFPPLDAAGAVAARGVPDGPDADIDNQLQLLLGALAVATRRARIVTPYFLPDDVVIRALQVAAMRGVEVDIVLPGRSNVPLMDWAVTPQLPSLLETGCRIYRSPPPFDHGKLFVVDGTWSLIGSSNWDARSLRLNFEYNVECFDRDLAARLDAIIDEKIAASQHVRLETLRSRPIPVRLRDGLARLLSPYL